MSEQTGLTTVTSVKDFETRGNGNAMTAAGQALVAREVQAVQGMIISAKNYPRSQGNALSKILQSCERVAFAEHAMYSYARGGQEITGPSIRLAEECARNWGNIDFGWREVERRPGESALLAFAWDLETNTRRTLEFTVLHVRNTKKGAYALTDERDIYEMNANQAARRVRQCILALIPGDVVDSAVNRCEGTLTSKESLEATRAKMIAAFKELDVTTDDIVRRMGKSIPALTSTDCLSLRKIWKSMKDSMSTKADWFEDVVDPQKITKVQNEAAAAPQQGGPATAEAAKLKAIETLETAIKAVRSKGADANQLLSGKLADIMLGSSATILAAADKLARWAAEQK